MPNINKSNTLKSLNRCPCTLPAVSLLFHHFQNCQMFSGSVIWISTSPSTVAAGSSSMQAGGKHVEFWEPMNNYLLTASQSSRNDNIKVCCVFCMSQCVYVFAQCLCICLYLMPVCVCTALTLYGQTVAAMPSRTVAFESNFKEKDKITQFRKQTPFILIRNEAIRWYKPYSFCIRAVHPSYLPLCAG